MDLSEHFWENKYLNNKTGWDLGEISSPLKEYFDQLEDKSLKILIPGGGNSYEAEYLFNKGFSNVFVVDIAETALQNLKKRVPKFPESQLIHGDFFQLKTRFDLIIEQTFFCALAPSLRQKYAAHMNDLLNQNGKLVGLLFDAKLNAEHPPFGGDELEYSSYFKKYFEFNTFEACYNSSDTRLGMELFLNLQKK